jgi:ribosomal protein S12 methylthiotransferase
MKKNQIDIITMGCSKNLVDSEQLMRQFEQLGYHCVHDSKRPQGEIAVINTCGFIETAKEESINTILEFVQAKNEGRLGRLYVMGCLSQRYQKELEESIPEVDKFYGKFNYRQLLQDLGPTASASTEEGQEAFTARRSNLQRKLTTPKHYAFIKIAEGCDRHCAYCAIPLITGRHVSRPIEEILQEVEQLAEAGVKEFQIIEQELTYYGTDLYGKSRIAELVSRMSDIKGVRWIRLHYAYPNQFPLELLDVMREKPNVASIWTLPCSIFPTMYSAGCAAMSPDRRHSTCSVPFASACRASPCVPHCWWDFPARQRTISGNCSTSCERCVSSAWAPLPIQLRRVPIRLTTMRTTCPQR